MRKRGWPLVIAANRLPVVRVRHKRGPAWKRSPGGLVSALTPIVQREGGAWVGWAGKAGEAPQRFEHDGIANLTVSISRDELHDYYDGFCNATLWPLYHGGIREPQYHRSWWRRYAEINRRFAELVADAASEGARLWIHDYHLQLAPGLVRQLRPDLRIGFFLHTPFPPEELFNRLPWRRQIVEGLLGSDVVGFQTREGARNFMRLARRHADAPRDGKYLQVNERRLLVDAFPISTDFEKYATAAEDEDIARTCEQLRQQLGGGRKIILGVDRLDYTKGIDVRLRALSELFASDERFARECVLVQVAVPSRERVSDYRELRSQIEELVGQINGEYSQVGTTPVQYIYREQPFEKLVALYRIADVALVTPLIDGMNLVAKEYVAARYDDTGVLILSEFAGAARELRSALLVNPYDVDGIAETLDMALSLPDSEIRRRMRRLRRVVRRNDVYRWADSFMQALAG
jgi:trehalose 6-phosphate synthase